MLKRKIVQTDQYIELVALKIFETEKPYLHLGL